MDPLWRERAACLTVDPEIFFPSIESGNRSPRTAQRICRTCPVLETCAYETFDEPYGVTGGMSENQRRRMRRAHLRPPLPGSRMPLPGDEGQAEVRMALAGRSADGDSGPGRVVEAVQGRRATA